MELPALKVGKPRPTPVVRGGITISKGKEDNPVDFEVNPEYFMQAYTEDCAGNQYNPWVTGTWRNY